MNNALSADCFPANVLITGGCGFIGSNFVNFAFDRWPQAKFVNLDKMAPGASEERIEKKCRNSDRYLFVKGNLTEATFIRNILTKNRIDTIVHFAALTHVDESYANPTEYMQENTVAMTVLLEAAKDHGQLAKLVHISTDEVYGDCLNAEEPKKEQSPMEPTNPYAVSKAACELLLRSYWHSYKVPYVMVRMNNVYGPKQFRNKLVPKFVRQALEKRPFTLAGGGTSKRSWMFVEDCIDGICRVIEKAALGTVYNIGTTFELSNSEMAYRIHHIVNRLIGREEAKPRFEFVPDRPHNDLRYWIDFSKIHRDLGWKCRIPFEEGITKTIAYYIEEWTKEGGGKTEEEKEAEEKGEIKEGEKEELEEEKEGEEEMEEEEKEVEEEEKEAEEKGEIKKGEKEELEEEKEGEEEMEEEKKEAEEEEKEVEEEEKEAEEKGEIKKGEKEELEEEKEGEEEMEEEEKEVEEEEKEAEEKGEIKKGEKEELEEEKEGEEEMEEEKKEAEEEEKELEEEEKEFVMGGGKDGIKLHNSDRTTQIVNGEGVKVEA
ncbi:hypothetical protein niasHT_007039 [Heterodera trifolii]|uniref:dTDP-D-glucose 4,6-dehydratase n=1 Tax=Heterodera trifolii TaxID=157864 RepID=A0ABD2LXF3_9BILA